MVLHLAALCPSPVEAGQVLTSLTRFVNLLAAGHSPPDVLPHLCGASLLTCKKKNVGLRPIAVDEVLWRLVSKCLSSAATVSSPLSLPLLQLGVSVRGGFDSCSGSADDLWVPQLPLGSVGFYKCLQQL